MKRSLINQKLFLEKNNDVLIKMIADITELDYNLLKNNIKTKDKKSDKNNDFIVEFDNENNIIVKLNTSVSNNTITKVTDKLFGMPSKIKRYKDKYINIIQIHLNYEKNCKKAISKYIIKQYINPQEYKNILCIEINPKICGKLYHLNCQNTKEIKWGAFLDCKNTKEIEKILSEILKEKNKKERMKKYE